MDRAPFRFPSPVLAMVLLFVMLLLLDYLSTTTFVKTRLGKGKERKVLLHPMLVLLEAPCDFCLRYMSVMFTPSFILIPAREIINGKEIGLITGWFAASQILALIFPILLHKAIRWIVAKTRYHVIDRKDRKLEKSRRAEEQRRASVATLVAVMSNINPLPPTKANNDLEEGKPTASRLVGGETMGSIATGLSGMTAIATAPLTVSIAPVTPVTESRGKAEGRQDAQRQLEHVQLETARQQGDPYAMVHTPLPEAHHHYPTSPRPASLHHNHRLHQSSDYFMRRTPRGRREAGESENGAGGVGRSRSLARSWASRATSFSPSRAGPRPRSGGAGAGATSEAVKGKFTSAVVGPGSALKHHARPQSASAASERSGKLRGDGVNSGLSPTFDEYIFQTRQDLISRRNSPLARSQVDLAAAGGDREIDPRQRNSEEGPGAETLVMPTLAPPTPTRSSHDEDGIKLAEPLSPTKADATRRPSKADSELTVSNDHPPSKPNLTPSPLPAEEQDEMDAIDRLIQRLWTFIPWFIFTLLLFAGIPLFYTINISLPLFLSINLLTFLCSITLVPAAIRRYAHPILTTSVATVFILWAFGAMRGWSLRRTLQSYSVDAKYAVLWSLSGYNGPVIGAGDVLFSTLDAGIVSLAIPMYRYRWDLWFHLVDMLVVLFPCSLLSLFVWPTVAGAIGIAPERALAFASRFMSTPLAIELSLTIGADESITVVLVVITGILISIFKDPFFRLFGLNPDLDGPKTTTTNDEAGEKGEKPNQDYLTIGIAMGSTAGAIGASSLISKPRCMAIASLSFVLFGAILLIFAAIPPVVDTLRMLAKAPVEFVPAS